MDKDLEAAIDKAGRSRVFSIAADNGWTAGNPPPKWVWWQICEQMNQQSIGRRG